MKTDEQTLREALDRAAVQIDPRTAYMDNEERLVFSEELHTLAEKGKGAPPEDWRPE